MPPQLSRLFLIFGFLIALFVVGRWLATPDSFYQYGHYRGKALQEGTDRDIKYAAVKSCEDCHDDQASVHKAGVHANISCQTCHGPGAQHVDDPSTSNIVKPKAILICARCHQTNSARPKKFPQVDLPDHNDGKSCDECHIVHSPSSFKGDQK